MININFTITNPWSKRWNSLWAKSQILLNNKAVEFNGYRTNTILNAELNFNIRTDHAGIRLMIGLLGYEVELHFYDTRHWDDEKNTWAKYG
jgi:hypothetical protein